VSGKSARAGLRIRCVPSRGSSPRGVIPRLQASGAKTCAGRHTWILGNLWASHAARSAALLDSTGRTSADIPARVDVSQGRWLPTRRALCIARGPSSRNVKVASECTPFRCCPPPTSQRESASAYRDPHTAAAGRGSRTPPGSAARIGDTPDLWCRRSAPFPSSQGTGLGQRTNRGRVQIQAQTVRGRDRQHRKGRVQAPTGSPHSSRRGSRAPPCQYATYRAASHRPDRRRWHCAPVASVGRQAPAER